MAGVAQLGYLGFEVSDLEAWKHFGTSVLGLGVVNEAEDGSFGLRMDSYQQRLFIRPGKADDLTLVGWEVADQAALDALQKRLEDAGFEVTHGTAEQARSRMVQELISFRDPGGNYSEAFFGAEKSSEPFESKICRSGFVAEDQGLGHLVITANNQQESHEFYTEVLGLRLSDHIKTELYGFKVNIAFFHANARHHSIAFGERQKKSLHHFMLEVKSFDDVGLCYDRTIKARLPIMQTLGRHPNDKMFSFYAMTPSGFQFEYGWGGRQVDDATWEPTTYDHISEWGHHHPQMLLPKKPKSESKQ